MRSSWSWCTHLQHVQSDTNRLHDAHKDVEANPEGALDIQNQSPHSYCIVVGLVPV